MPVHHFIFHAYGSWLPDRPEGYFKHGSLWQPPNEQAEQQYRKNMQEEPIAFNKAQQQLLIEELIRAQPYQRINLYSAATDSTHVHAVVAWTDDRDPVRIRSGLKSSLTRMMNTRYGKRQWFVAKAGQTPIRGENHLTQLVHDYLPKHTLYWYYKSEENPS
ncbi:MAG: hypothetical protein ACE37H_14320 [Phycisphaeraceae bacterium]